MSTRFSRVFSVAVGLVVGAGMLNVLTAAAGPTVPSPVQARRADPQVGPHAADEAKHRDQRVALTPAHSAILPRRSATVPGSLAARSAGPRLAQASALNGRPAQREVMGFVPYWSLPAEASWDYSLLSTIAYFGLDVNADGSFATSTRGWTGWNSQEFVDAINRAHQAGDRAVVVIKAFDEATINSIVTTGAAQTAITNTINAIAQKNLDGVNIDFEGYASSSFPSLPAGLVNFATQMTAQVHQRFPGSTVTIDTYSGSASWDGGIFNISQLAPAVDGLFVMAYDMSFGNLSGHAAPNAPLYGWTYNDTNSVAQYLSKAPASKVILGVPYYAYKWSTTTNQPYGTASGGATAVTYSNIAGDFACAQRLSLGWDSTAQSPWASWWSPAVNDPCGANHNSWRELYYDNADSLGLKYDLVNAQGLAGVGMWALGYDGNAPELWNVIARKLVNPFKAMYTLDGFGGLHPVGGSLPATTTGYWSGWKIARAGALLPDASGGFVLEGFGGVHPFRVGSNPLPTSVTDYAYWNGWDIARDIVLLPTSTATRPQGYTLDGFGGVHQFGGAPVARGAPYWGWDIARRLALLSDGTGGYVVDGYGAVHPFAVGDNPMPPALTNYAYWPGWNIARDLALVPGSTPATVGGVTLDGFGGPHQFGNAGGTTGFAYWKAWDIARSVRLSPASTAAQPQGWVLDGFGGVHQFGGAPAVSMSAYWNWDIAVSLLIA
jgi:GH18 family chitinase